MYLAACGRINNLHLLEESSHDLNRVTTIVRTRLPNLFITPLETNASLKILG